MADDRLFGQPKLILSELAAHLNVSSSTLAEASGFASRSAFYKVFRRATGLTPTEFRVRTRTG